MGLDFSLNNNTCKTDHKEDIKLSNNEKEKNEDDEFIVLTHSFAMTHRYLEKKVKDNFQVKNLYETHAGCVISAHGGKGSIGLAYILNDK